MKCFQCQSYSSIVECKECKKELCFNCDDRIHNNQATSRHLRSTLPFHRESKSHTYFSRRPTSHMYTEGTPDHDFKSPKGNVYKSFILSPQQSSISKSQIYENYSMRQSKAEMVQKKVSNRYGVDIPKQPNCFIDKKHLPSQSLQVEKSQIQKYEEPQIEEQSSRNQEETRDQEELECSQLEEDLNQEIKQFDIQQKEILQMLENARQKDQIKANESQQNLQEYRQRLLKLKEVYQVSEAQIQKKQEELDRLPEVSQQKLQILKSEIAQLRQAQEIQIEELEKGVIASTSKLEELMEDEQIQEEEEEIEDQEENEQIEEYLKAMQEDLKQVTEEAAKRSVELKSRGQKCDELSAKVVQTTQLQAQQIAKMDEIIQIFKLCSQEMEKEKQLLLLDNEKLIAEVEIFGKFFDENQGLIDKIAQAGPLQQQE